MQWFHHFRSSGTVNNTIALCAWWQKQTCGYECVHCLRLPLVFHCEEDLEIPSNSWFSWVCMGSPESDGNCIVATISSCPHTAVCIRISRPRNVDTVKCVLLNLSFMLMYLVSYLLLSKFACMNQYHACVQGHMQTQGLCHNGTKSSVKAIYCLSSSICMYAGVCLKTAYWSMPYFGVQMFLFSPVNTVSNSH